MAVLSKSAGPAIGWPVACPACREPFGDLPEDGDIACPCGNGYGCVDGIWRFLPRERLEALQPFLDDYTRIRLAEGRGSDDPAYYLGLPECPADHPIAAQWALRRRTFETLRCEVLPGLGQGLRILDLGAGVGWLSRRLADDGHYPCAVDLSVDDRDGLGSARHYNPKWPRLQAEFDRLPLSDESVDVALYNASLHYSVDYRATLAEAMRVLRPGGSIVLLETPIYRREESGRRMAADRHAAFATRYGTASTALASIEFLTWGMLEELGRELGLKWKWYRTWYGWKRAMRPFAARVQGQREPSRFVVLVGRRT